MKLNIMSRCLQMLQPPFFGKAICDWLEMSLFLQVVTKHILNCCFVMRQELLSKCQVSKILSCHLTNSISLQEGLELPGHC
jgi:hypothetical protein